MTNRLTALVIAALALYSFFILPGHTYLTQDTQIYVPILENLWDPTALSHDLLVGQSHVAYTLYDEYAIAVRWLTHSSFSLILQATQILCRALGIWGVYLLALAILKHRVSSLAVAAVYCMGGEVWGPSVLLVELEPSPRSFALPLLFLALGFVAHRRYTLAASTATVGFLIHPTTVAPFWLILALLQQWRIGFVSLISGVLLLGVAAHFQPGMPERQLLFTRVSPYLESIQRHRSAYNWVGLWFRSEWWKYLVCLAVGALAYRRLRPALSPELRLILAALPAFGLLCALASYLLLDDLKWAVIPQVQPARQLLFVVAIPVILAAAAAFRSKRVWEAPVWLALALTPAVAGPRPRVVPTPALTRLATWAAQNTPKDSVFLFPEAGHSLEPGVFRAQALRAVYVDWKGGGQANFLPQFGLEWWRRYQDVMTKPQTLEHYRSLGIDYVVFPGTPYRIVKVSPK